MPVYEIRGLSIFTLSDYVYIRPFLADTDAVVKISNRGTNGYVIADAVQFLSADERSEKAPREGIDGAEPSKVEFARRRMESLKQALTALDASAPPPSPVAMAPSDRPSNELIDSRVHIRGEVNNLGESVARGFLQVLGEGGSSILNPQGSGRLELADWLTDPDNPLTSRVFVNRVWMYLFGEGLVRTVDNFVMLGERRTPPELLDFLATRFVRNGWRLKPLVRELVLSHAYSQSSAYDENSIAIDPENRLLWRVNRRRLTAESIRAAMIAATGRLERQPRLEPMAGRGVLVSSNQANSAASFDDLAQSCRSIYLPVVRS